MFTDLHSARADSAGWQMLTRVGVGVGQLLTEGLRHGVTALLRWHDAFFCFTPHHLHHETAV